MIHLGQLSAATVQILHHSLPKLMQIESMHRFFIRQCKRLFVDVLAGSQVGFRLLVFCPVCQMGWLPGFLAVLADASVGLGTLHISWDSEIRCVNHNIAIRCFLHSEPNPKPD